MNISFNQRYQSTEDKIQTALFSLLKIRKYNDISIKEICYEAGINRSSFYAHYQDINDLMIKTEQKLSKQIIKIFNPNQVWNEEIFIKLFEFLYKNKNFYKSYLCTNEQAFIEKNDFTSFITIINKSNKCLNFEDNEKFYHMAFFSGGLKALSKAWLQTDCKESPSQMAKILTDEYRVNSKFFK